MKKTTHTMIFSLLLLCAALHIAAMDVEAAKYMNKLKYLKQDLAPNLTVRSKQDWPVIGPQNMEIKLKKYKVKKYSYTTRINFEVIFYRNIPRPSDQVLQNVINFEHDHEEDFCVAVVDHNTGYLYTYDDYLDYKWSGYNRIVYQHSNGANMTYLEIVKCKGHVTIDNDEYHDLSLVVSGSSSWRGKGLWNFKYGHTKFGSTSYYSNDPYYSNLAHYMRIWNGKKHKACGISYHNIKK